MSAPLAAYYCYENKLRITKEKTVLSVDTKPYITSIHITDCMNYVLSY